MGNKPYAKVNVSNGIQIVFWVNEPAEKDYERLSPVISKSYKDAKGEWHESTIHLNMNDLYRLFSVGQRVKDVEDAFKEEQKAQKVGIAAEGL